MEDVNDKPLSEIDSTPKTDEVTTISEEEAKAKAQELMEIISDPSVLRAYRAIRGDVYGKKNSRQVSQKEKKKKKAKRRMAKKSKK